MQTEFNTDLTNPRITCDPDHAVISKSVCAAWQLIAAHTYADILINDKPLAAYTDIEIHRLSACGHCPQASFEVDHTYMDARVKSEIHTYLEELGKELDTEVILGEYDRRRLAQSERYHTHNKTEQKEAQALEILTENEGEWIIPGDYDLAPGIFDRLMATDNRITRKQENTHKQCFRYVYKWEDDIADIGNTGDTEYPRTQKNT